MANIHRLSCFTLFRIHLLSVSPQPLDKKRYSKFNSLRFSKKAKCLIAFAIIAVIVISAFGFVPNKSGADDNNLQPTVTATASSTLDTTTGPSATKSTITSGPSSIHPSTTNGTPISGGSQGRGSGIIQSATTIDKGVWIQIASNAWNSFAVNSGVDGGTGLPYAGGKAFKSFTDWDLGVYIQSIINAQKMDLIKVDGPWGSYDRVNRVLTFLETRELQVDTKYPYWFYNAVTGEKDPVTSISVTGIDCVDTGRLFVALNNLRNFKTLTDYNPTIIQRVNNFVNNNVTGAIGNRTNYQSLIGNISASDRDNSFYSYYVISGFASFFKQISNLPNTILDNLFSKTTTMNVTYQGTPLNVTLPLCSITSEPLYAAIFELNIIDSRVLSYARNVYLAHEAYYNVTGAYAAFSEGDSEVGFIYEWIIGPDGGCWEITNSQQNQYYNINPIIYAKIAFSFLALYNTTYAKNASIYVENALPDPTNGYGEGADYNANPGAVKIVNQVGSNTNGLILDAALYVYQH